LAKKTNKYEKLYCEDIENFVNNHDLAIYSKVVCFDVFCYIGNLENVFDKLRGKEVWFSIETADEERGKDFYLAPSGRYKHSIKYIKGLAQRFNFQEIQMHNMTLRMENGSPVLGSLIKIK
jgi:predicted TPR repeat methyltransferase